MIKISHMTRLALAASLGAAAFAGPAQAASSKEAEYVHPDCEGKNAVCGAIVMANGGAFTLASVKVKARGSQPSQPGIHSSCADVNKKLTKDVPAGNYDVFKVPASCAYELSISIKSANSKDMNVFLTPGCVLQATVSGTASSNQWKTLELSTANNQVPTNSSGKPIDPGGHKCGKQSGYDK